MPRDIAFPYIKGNYYFYSSISKHYISVFLAKMAPPNLTIAHLSPLPYREHDVMIIGSIRPIDSSRTGALPQLACFILSFQKHFSARRFTTQTPLYESYGNIDILLQAGDVRFGTIKLNQYMNLSPFSFIQPHLCREMICQPLPNALASLSPGPTESHRIPM